MPAASTAVSVSPPGASLPSGERRQARSRSPSEARISATRRPSQSPWPISRRSASAVRGSASASPMAAAVAVVRASGECQMATGAPGGVGRAGGRSGSARRAARSAAWRSPCGESGGSAAPWKRPSVIQVDSPCRQTTRVASRSRGIGRGSLATAGRPLMSGARPTGRRPPRARGCARPPRRGWRRRRPGS